MERWIHLQDYPGYSVSDLGRIRNDKRGNILAVVRTQSKHCYVSFMQNRKHVTRGVAKLVAQAFVRNPRPGHFNTPIHLDGDLSNNRASNLVWRSRWFAMKYTQQFLIDQGEFPAIRNTKTGEVIQDIWELVVRDGVLYTDVVLSITNKTYVSPTMQIYEWVE